jgi:hypothetical protein
VDPRLLLGLRAEAAELLAGRHWPAPPRNPPNCLPSLGMRPHADAIAQDLILRYYETLDGTLGAQNNMARTLHCAALLCTALLCSALLCFGLRCIGLRCAALHWTGLLCAALLLRCAALDCAAGAAAAQDVRQQPAELPDAPADDVRDVHAAGARAARAAVIRRNPLGVLGVLGVGLPGEGRADPNRRRIHPPCTHAHARACARDRLRRCSGARSAATGPIDRLTAPALRRRTRAGLRSAARTPAHTHARTHARRRRGTSRSTSRCSARRRAPSSRTSSSPSSSPRSSTRSSAAGPARVYLSHSTAAPRRAFL